MADSGHAPAIFDGDALIRALDTERDRRALQWPALADALWRQSEALNDRLGDHRLCSGALVRTARRGTMSCQYAVILLRWLGRAPEEFLTSPSADVGDVRLPHAGPGQRLRWNLAELHELLGDRRRQRGLTWAALAGEFACTPNQLTNLKTARFTDMGLAMRITQSLGVPAARFIHPADW